MSSKHKKAGKRINNKVFQKKVGDRIKQLMKEKKITFEVFYNDTSIHPNRILTGESNMTISTLEKVCVYLNISLADFFKDLK